MNDIFREVDEEYRHEQLLQFWHANAKLIMATLVLAIAAAAGVGFWKSHQMAQRQTETYILAHAVGDASMQKPADAQATLAKAASEITGHRLVAARFAEAHQTLVVGDKVGAVKLYDSIAADGAATSTERDLADLNSISAQIQDGDPAQLSGRLDHLSQDRNAFRFSARELQVLLAMRQNDMQKAHDIAAALAQDKAAPDGIHTRAGQLAALTGEGLAPSAADIAAATTPTVELPEAR